MENIDKTKLAIGGLVALAAAGLTYYATRTPRGTEKAEEETTVGDPPKEEVKTTGAPPKVRERSFIMIKPDGV